MIKIQKKNSRQSIRYLAKAKLITCKYIYMPVPSIIHIPKKK